MRKRLYTVFLAILGVGAIVATSAIGREKWPAEPAEHKAAVEAARKVTEEHWQAIQPELAEWARKGKPYLVAASQPSDVPQAAIPAFPGAEGGGMYSFGGRGGRVFVVTSLEDSGPGTLREAVESAGPRIVVFNVAGIIHLKSVLDIRAPYITIAGQTAPGDGVCIAGQSTWVDTHDVVIRYMRFRRGETDVYARDDSLGGNPVGNVIVDHCSCSWGLDENVSMYRHMYQPPDGKELKRPTYNITIQWTISSEALNPYNHAFGGTWGGTNDVFHHNLLACNTGRNCSIGMGGDFNYINNVIFNWRHRTLDGGDDTTRANVINNYYKPGPVTPDTAIRYRIVKGGTNRGKDVPKRYGQFYVAGNIIDGNEAVTKNNWAGGVQAVDPAGTGSEDTDPGPDTAPSDAAPPPAGNKPQAIVTLPPDLAIAMHSDKPFPMAHVTIQPAAEAYESVLNGAGATLPKRDSVDTRIVEEVRTGKVTYTEGKGIITDIKQVGGYPEYKGEPVLYTQHDGIPDWWKKKYNLDVNDANLATQDSNGDGYTNVEKYLDGIDPTKTVDWKDLKNNINPLGAIAANCVGREMTGYKADDTMTRKRSIVLTTIVGLGLTGIAVARESWPAPPPDVKARLDTYDQHEKDLLQKIKPELDEWAKKGKPFIPWAAKPGDLPQADIPAFPGAEGGGMYSFGGRGGKVYVVTTLEDSGPGSLREACEAAGPRIVVFNVAGIIHLKMPIFIEAPYITIAGQTAPGDGICIADQGITDNAHDVVIRYIRLRRGNTDIYNRHGTHYGNPVGNIMLDHVSASWGSDQNMDTYRHMYQPPEGGPALKLPAVNVTIQWCITSEGLNTWNHAFGGDWGGRNTGFHHNLFACNTGRNPSIAMTYDFNFVNNVLFNWRHRTLDGGDDKSLVNCINNYYKPGPATNHGQIAYRIGQVTGRQPVKNGAQVWGKWYAAGNIMEGYEKITADNWAGGIQFSDPTVSEDVPPPEGETPTTGPARVIDTTTDRFQSLVKQVRSEKPFPMPPMTIQTAREAYDSVLANAGDTLPRRDPVDQRVTTEVKTGVVWGLGQHIPTDAPKGLPKNDIGMAGNGIITDVSQVGGYPEYKGTPIVYSQNDGIPDWWKKKYNLDVNDPDLASKDSNGDGYTNIEKYLDGLDPTKKVDWKDLKNNVNPLGSGEVLRGS